MPQTIFHQYQINVVFTFLLPQVQIFFYVVVNYDSINNDFVQPHENFQMKFEFRVEAITMHCISSE